MIDYNYSKIVESYKKIDRELSITEDEYKTICDILNCEIREDEYITYDYDAIGKEYLTNGGMGNVGYFAIGLGGKFYIDANYKPSTTALTTDSVSWSYRPTACLNIKSIITHIYYVYCHNEKLGEICNLTFGDVVRGVKKVKKKEDNKRKREMLSFQKSY